MSDKTGIEWTDATWNPVTGCAKVSQGCKHCYAEREWPRMTKLVPAYAGRDFTDVRTHADRLDQPLRWKKPRMIFVNSMSDLFHPDVPDEFIDQVFDVMERARTRRWAGDQIGWKWNDGHVFQVLTKRADRMRDYVVARLAKKRSYADKFNDCPTEEMRNSPAAIAARADADCLPPYIWLGVSVEDQKAADERIPLLLDTPAAVRWISAEPLLGYVDLGKYLEFYCGGPGAAFGLDWVVAGGESGQNARPMHPDWVRSLRNQCKATEVPFLFKQWGEWAPADAISDDYERKLEERWLTIFGAHIDPDNGVDFFNGDDVVYRAGKRHTGRLLDGVQHDGYPGGAT